MSSVPASKPIAPMNAVAEETKRRLVTVSAKAEEVTGNAVRAALQSRLWEKPQTWLDKIEAFVSSLSVRDNFWHRVCSLIWLPYAFFSGIRMKKIDETTFSAILPFTRFNRNWYRAMAGAALLGNCEVAGGMYVFGICGSDYTVVCKHLDYKFLRPCLGPAEYKMKPREDIYALISGGTEFNLTLEMDVLQHVRDGQRDRRVGRAQITFHVTPKSHVKARAEVDPQGRHGTR